MPSSRKVDHQISPVILFFGSIPYRYCESSRGLFEAEHANRHQNCFFNSLKYHKHPVLFIRGPLRVCSLLSCCFLPVAQRFITRRRIANRRCLNSSAFVWLELVPVACQCCITSTNWRHKEKKSQKLCALTSNQTGEDSGNTPGRLVSSILNTWFLLKIELTYIAPRNTL